MFRKLTLLIIVFYIFSFGFPKANGESICPEEFHQDPKEEFIDFEKGNIGIFKGGALSYRFCTRRPEMELELWWEDPKTKELRKVLHDEKNLSTYYCMPGSGDF